MTLRPPLKVALIHDWLTGMRGGESVLEAIAELFPKAELFTLLYVPGKISPILTALKRHTSLLQKMPRAEHRYRYALPVMPWLIERFDLAGFDLIISSSHCVAKGIRKPKDAVHVSYIHAPMRYMWDRYDDYFGPGKASPHVKLVAKALRPKIQAWDRKVSSKENVDLLIANSHFIKSQIQNAYAREAKVIHPFVNLERFSVPRVLGRNYLMVGAFAPNKRVDLAIEAFNRLKLPLLIVGGGQDEQKLKKMAGPTIEFFGSLSSQAIVDFYSKCRAFVFPGVEDFGITPLEAMAVGAPVIAYQAGGALETVTPKTGVFFAPQTVEALMEAVLKIERGEIKIAEADCRQRALEFSRERFQKELLNAIRETWTLRGKDPQPLEELIKKGWARLS